MAIHEQKEEKYGAMGENGETIKIGTVVQHPVARPPCLLFYSLPNEDTRRASRDDAMVKKKKKGGGRGKQCSIWHIRKQQRVLFDIMLGSEKSAHRAAGSLTATGS